MNGSAIPDPVVKPRFEPGPLCCVVEYHYANTKAYEQRRHETRYIRATSLTESGARLHYNDMYRHRKGEKRWRVGENWFSYRVMWISEVRLEQL